MRILLLGCNGQVGWELQRSLSVLGEVIALGSNAQKNPQGLKGNLTDLGGLAQTVQVVRPDVIVNAAAYTAVDKAESESEQAHTINALAPGVLASEAHKLGAWLIHYSTDYVFDGSGTTPWVESDVTSPLSVYGATKLEGEQRIAAHTPKHLILRTSWVYGARGGNFAKTMLRLASEREALTVINDQFGAPTSAELLADVTAHAIRSLQSHPDLAGLYHCVAAGETSWHGYARFVLQTAQALGTTLKAGPEQVKPTSTQSYPTPAKRPLNSRLNTAKLQDAFNLTLPHWQAGVSRMLTEISGK
jgi:dTDP-4-dehydrorhamnose reductase